MMPDAASIKAAKANLSHFLITWFERYRKIRTPNGQGGFVEAFAKLDDVQGRMTMAGTKPGEGRIGGKWPAEVTHVFFAGTPRDFRRGDELRLSARRWRIIAREEPSLLGVTYEVLCQEVQEES